MPRKKAPKAPIPLWWRLATLMTGVVLVCFLGFGAYMADRMYVLESQELVSTAEGLAGNIDAAAVEEILTERWDNVELLLLRLSSIDNVRELTVADRDGKVMSRVVRDGPGRGKVAYNIGASVPVPDRSTTAVVDGRLVYSMPITRGERLGVVVVVLSLENLRTVREEIYLNDLRATLIAFVIAVALLWLGLRSTVRDLGKAAEFAATLSANRGAQLALKCDVAEVRTLVDSLNGMSTELASRYQALEDSEVRKKAILEASLDCLITIDEGGRIVEFNSAAEMTFGYDADEVLDRSMASVIIPPAMRRAHHDGMARYLKTRQSKVMRRRLEMTALRRDGSEFPVEIAIVPFEIDGHHYFSSYLRDITLRKAVEHDLEESRKRALEAGRVIQRSLLAGDIPEQISGAWIHCHSEPSQGIDGDFISIKRYSETCFEVLVGDVMGKGVAAALFGAAVKNTYSHVLSELLAVPAGQGRLPEPEEIVNGMHESLTGRLIELNTFVTLALYRFDLVAGTLTYVNAGHTPALLARGSGAEFESVHGENLPVGVILDEVYVQKCLSIAVGDILLVYSDGITEARNAEMQEFGEERLRLALKQCKAAGLPSAAAMQAIRQQVREFVGNRELSDDRTAVMVEWRPRRQWPRKTVSERVAPTVFEIPWRLDTLALLRSNVASAAGGLAVEDRSAIVLAAVEVATNIVRHRMPPFADSTLVCRTSDSTDALTVEFLYPGKPFKPEAGPLPDFSGETEGGFGLYIIEKSVDLVEYATPVAGICSVRLVKRHKDKVNVPANA